MKLSDFDFPLPNSLIAQKPAKKRENSNLLIAGANNPLVIDKFHNIIDYLLPGDLMVFNDSKVIKAKLILNKSEKKVELYLNKQIIDNQWYGFAKPSKRLNPGDQFDFDGNKIIIMQKLGMGQVEVKFELLNLTVFEFLEKYGETPLPPYIKRKEFLSEDISRYQTVYSKNPGAVAAPTAGLHFSKDLLASIKAKKVDIVFITLHVGAGTFLPVKTDDIAQHKMHSEYYQIDKITADKINKAKKDNKRIIAVGTTSLRSLESSTIAGQIQATNVFDEAENGDFSNLALLNNPDFEVDALNEKGCSLLHYAIGHNNPSTGEHLIKYFHANPNIATVQSGRVPLHLAVDTQNINSVRMLLDCEADPNIQAKMGKNTPMHLAAAKHQHDSPASLEILKLLIEAGTKVSILNSASLLAVDCLDSKTFDELLPSFTKYIDTGNTVEEKQKRLGETISELIFATQYYSPEPAHPMTNLDKNMKTHEKYKVVFDKAREGDFSGLILLNHPDFEANALDGEGYSLLHYAVFHDYDNIGEYLISYRHVNPNIASINNGEVPLHTAVLAQNVDSVKMLLDCEADPNIQFNDSGNTALHLAGAIHWREDSDASLNILKLLIKSGAKISIHNNTGLLAIDGVDPDIFEELLPSFSEYINTGSTLEEKQERLIETIFELVFTARYNSPEPSTELTNCVKQQKAKELVEKLQEMYESEFAIELLVFLI
ncbi:S-adenosylmethionine:tRNA ribosyltransferase-isomerase [Pseudolycoriella hygida]|uniref:S-adenosylmethionine:tRNA ribosyltransferase-isomerase n=1 Tax=Pseudolycoriella hygida TaxID=35572 RepID=A0A9Q0N777_9DIPT|nr:S-adenosylmethionine:tRNA ribosyltransferase-isomerase [Pseudolycoriella hygida]